MIICLILSACSLIAISGAIGMYLDLEKKFKDPQLYWALGIIFGYLAGLCTFLIDLVK